jgi:phage-related protein
VSDRPAGGWTIGFYREDDGSLPVMSWLDGLPEAVRGKIIARIDLLREGGPALDYPYTSQIEGRLRELRLRVGKTRYRVLYFFDEQRTAILLHGFSKNSATVEDADKRIGNRRMAKHEARLAGSIGRQREGRQNR